MNNNSPVTFMAGPRIGQPTHTIETTRNGREGKELLLHAAEWAEGEKAFGFVWVVINGLTCYTQAIVDITKTSEKYPKLSDADKREIALFERDWVNELKRNELEAYHTARHWINMIRRWYNNDTPKEKILKEYALQNVSYYRDQAKQIRKHRLDK